MNQARQRGGAAFEYIAIIVIVAIVAVGATYWYRTHVVQKGFQQSMDSIDAGEDLISGDLTRETSKVSGIKFSGPMLLAIGCIVVLMLILMSTLKAAKRAKRGLRDLKEDEDGQAMTEFILTFPLLLFITLCIMQLSLIYTARLVVNYSAFSAARAAVVFIPLTFEDEVAGQINIKKEDGKRTKLERIRDAARLTCMPVSTAGSVVLQNFRVTVMGYDYYPLSTAGSIIGDALSLVADLFNAVGGIFGSDDFGNYVASAINRYTYSYFFTNVELLDSDFNVITDGRSYGREVVTVRVNHAFYCGIPIANAFLGEKWGWNLFDEIGLTEFSDLFGGLSLDEYTTEISGGYVFKLHGDCTMLVEMKQSH